MGIGTSIVVFAVGAIMRFAVTATATGFNIHTVGDILMIVGAVGFVVSLIFWSSWGAGGPWSGRRTATRTTTNAPYGPGGTYVSRTDQEEVV